MDGRMEGIGDDNSVCGSTHTHKTPIIIITTISTHPFHPIQSPLSTSFTWRLRRRRKREPCLQICIAFLPVHFWRGCTFLRTIHACQCHDHDHDHGYCCFLLLPPPIHSPPPFIFLESLRAAAAWNIVQGRTFGHQTGNWDHGNGT